MQQSDNDKWDSLLTDESEKDEDVQYIQPNIDIQLPANKRMECREILKQIKDFGVNQRQILYLVYLLSLEMEDRDVMLAISKAIGEVRDQVKVSKLILGSEEA